MRNCHGLVPAPYRRPYALIYDVYSYTVLQLVQRLQAISLQCHVGVMWAVPFNC